MLGEKDLVPGHEFTGHVIAIGSAVTRFGIGDRVAVGTIVDSCGECPMDASSEALGTLGDTALEVQISAGRHGASAYVTTVPAPTRLATHPGSRGEGEPAVQVDGHVTIALSTSLAAATRSTPPCPETGVPGFRAEAFILTAVMPSSTTWAIWSATSAGSSPPTQWSYIRNGS